MAFSPQNISVGDWVIVDDEEIGLSVEEGEVLEIIDEKGCYITSEEFDKVAVYWDEILSSKNYCNSCENRKLYHDTEERWKCPFCKH